eukprot:Phypoly_transcript_07005.p1 GENE.Phypoly_transcript_07005~~Phypoly_transcript_07005.p1  ORF type:complete len:486 (+),score=33.73 Phypoly_transcript_07005:105-1562(+)
MRFGYIFIDTIYPLLLVIASITRPSLISFIYLVAFVIASIWSPHPLLPIRNALIHVHVIIIFCVSLASILGQVVFNVEYKDFPHIIHNSTLPNSTNLINETTLDFNFHLYDFTNSNTTQNITVNVPDVYVLFGFHEITDFVSGLHQILPDLVILVVTVYLLVQLFKYKVLNQHVDHHLYRPPIYSKLITSISFVLTFIVAVSFASVMTSIFLGLYLVMMLLVSMGGKKIHTLQLMFYPVTLFLTASSVILYNVFQVPLIHKAMAPHVGTWLGVFHYTQFSRTTWPVVTCYAALVLLFLLTVSTHKIRAVRRAYFGSDRLSPRQKEMGQPFLATSNSYRNHPEYALPESWHVATLFSNYGWALCVLATIALCYFIEPSVCSTILLLAAFIGTLIPVSWFAPGARVLTVFFIGFFFAQFVFNILNASVAGVKSTEATDNIGLKVRSFENEWLYWGAQALVLFSYAIYSYSSYLPKTGKTKQIIDDGT